MGNTFEFITFIIDIMISLWYIAFEPVQGYTTYNVFGIMFYIPDYNWLCQKPLRGPRTQRDYVYPNPMHCRV